MGFLLSILSRVLFSIVGIVNPFVVIVKYAKSHGFLKTINKYFFLDAVSVDVFGNYAYRSTWNLIFITKKGYRFGRKGETISSALGKNQQLKTLAWVGKGMVWILWVIDFKYWGKGGHCLNSIMNDEEIYIMALK